MSWGPDLEDKIPNAKKPEAGRHGSWEHQEARLTVLPAQDGALPDRAVPQLDEEPAHPRVLVLTSSWDRPGRTAKGSLQRAAPP